MLNSINKTAVLGIITVGFLSLNNSFALHSTLQDAVQLRSKIIYNEHLRDKNTINRRVVLPVSRGFDQQKTCLCWSYAFFNALESLYLVEHPDSKLEISRGAMQYINLQDRIDLKIDGIEDHLDPTVYRNCGAEGGTPLSAEYLMKNYGAVPYAEYHDIISPPNYTDLHNLIFVDNTTPKQKKTVTAALLPAYFGADIPETTYFNGQLLSGLEFVNQIMPKGRWTTYALSKDGSDYIARGLDPDARRNEQTHFIAKEHFIQKINQSLAQKRPVIYSNNHHVILIYGADYNQNDELISFYIKDSYERLGYYYKADFEKALKEIMEMTVLESTE
jgi:hypothetical protein